MTMTPLGGRCLDGAEHRLHVPPVWLHAAPVCLALSCLLLSLTRRTVFFAFEEHRPGTWLSLSLLYMCLLVCISAARRADLEVMRRRVGAVLAVLVGLAAADEQNQWHEMIGRYVQHHVHTLPAHLTLYTDDLMILAASVGGIAVLGFCLRLVGREPRLRPYLIAIGIAAISHGTLDLLGHKHYIWKLIWPDLTYTAAYANVHRLSYFEETCKLWTEWFVLLFLLRFLHRLPVSWRWSALVAAASAPAAFGIWTVADPAAGVPYMIMGKAFRLLRNGDVYLCLATPWILAATVIWRHCRDDDDRRLRAGLLLLAPWALLPATLRQALPPAVGGAMLLLAVRLAGLAAAAVLWRRQRHLPLAAGLFLVSGWTGAAWASWPASLAGWLRVGGPLWALLIVRCWGRRTAPPSRQLARLSPAAAVAMLNPWWLLVLFAALVGTWATTAVPAGDAGEARVVAPSPRRLALWQMAACLAIGLCWRPVLIPNPRHFRPREVILFETGRQPLDSAKPSPAAAISLGAITLDAAAAPSGQGTP